MPSAEAPESNPDISNRPPPEKLPGIFEPYDAIGRALPMGICVELILVELLTGVGEGVGVKVGDTGASD
jgi:hypothetical protein